MDIRPQSLDVFIDELVLDGFEDADQVQLVAAIQREFSRFISHPLLPAKQIAAASDVDDVTFNLWSTIDAESISAHIARAVKGVLIP